MFTDGSPLLSRVLPPPEFPFIFPVKPAVLEAVINLKGGRGWGV